MKDQVQYLPHPLQRPWTIIKYFWVSNSKCRNLRQYCYASLVGNLKRCLMTEYDHIVVIQNVENE